ncbi:hypothetical protein [Eudoraea adriatica]|uniref:hypothetical protein n=1 Tax=Eudoraea adriatica TaxID=446681 RepID=UPI00037043EE|nr:hypothetical protein [Eudoraea adriatica]
MNKLLLLCGLVLLGTTTTPQENKLTTNCTLTEDSTHVSIDDVNNPEVLAMQIETEWKAPKLVSRTLVNAPEDIKVSEIVYIEEETSIDLGFDTVDYLPEGFDPYDVYFDINSVEFIDDEVTELGFDTAAYLPENFNAYANPGTLDAINYIEEEAIDLGFDTAKYLPEGFDPHEFYLDLDSVEYIEDEDDLDFNFSTADYLPVGFNPLSR